MRKHFTCDECDADFKINSNLDEEYYEVHFCPFCGAQITDEEDEEEDYEVRGYTMVSLLLILGNITDLFILLITTLTVAVTLVKSSFGLQKENKLTK